MKKDLDFVARLEKAIKTKYGEDAIKNPLSFWNKEKEDLYLSQVSEESEADIKKAEKVEKVEVEGFFVSKKLLNRETNRTCPVCEVYSFDMKDDLYMEKFECCFGCYIEYVHNREDRWNTGWRPKEKADKEN